MLHSSKYCRNFFSALSLITVLLFLPSCRYLREKGLFLEKNRKEVLLWAQKDSMRVADSLKEAAAFKDVAQEAKPDSFVQDMNENTPEAENKKMYYLIIGSFANSENAKSVADEYSRQGYKTSIIKAVNSGGQTIELVSIKTFDNFEEAVSYGNAYQSKNKSNVWVYPTH